MMLLLDTNVLSELMRLNPNEGVVQWMDAQPDDEVWVSAVTVGEIRLGIATGESS
jgi:toxin FitB